MAASENGVGEELADGVPEEFFVSVLGVSTVVVIVTDGIAEINVPGLHVADEYASIDSSKNGGVATFRLASRGIKSISGQGGNSAAATIDWYVSAINN